MRLSLLNSVPEPRNGPGNPLTQPKAPVYNRHLKAARHPGLASCYQHPPPQGRAPQVSYVALWPARHGYPPTPPSQYELGVGRRLGGLRSGSLPIHRSARDREGRPPGQGSTHYRKLLLAPTSWDKGTDRSLLAATGEMALTVILTAEILPAPGC